MRSNGDRCNLPKVKVKTPSAKEEYCFMLLPVKFEFLQTEEHEITQIDGPPILLMIWHVFMIFKPYPAHAGGSKISRPNPGVRVCSSRPEAADLGRAARPASKSGFPDGWTDQSDLRTAGFCDGCDGIVASLVAYGFLRKPRIQKNSECFSEETWNL